MTWNKTRKRLGSGAGLRFIKRTVLVATMAVMLGGSMTAYATETDAAVEKGTAVIKETGNAATDATTEQTAEATDSSVSADQSTQSAADGNQNPNAFSVAGNATVVDQISDGSTKDFYTIRTANNQTFYLIIDHANNVENVYMLSTIDETDLQDFIETEGSKPGVVLNDSILTESQEDTSNSDESAGVSLEEESEDENTDAADDTEKETPLWARFKGLLVGILITAIVVVVLIVIFKLVLPNRKKDTPESENLENPEQFETIEETDEDLLEDDPSEDGFDAGESGSEYDGLNEYESDPMNETISDDEQEES